MHGDARACKGVPVPVPMPGQACPCPAVPCWDMLGHPGALLGHAGTCWGMLGRAATGNSENAAPSHPPILSPERGIDVTLVAAASSAGGVPRCQEMVPVCWQRQSQH